MEWNAPLGLCTMQCNVENAFVNGMWQLSLKQGNFRMSIKSLVNLSSHTKTQFLPPLSFKKFYYTFIGLFD